MDKLQLEYFLSVANTLNISKSAEHLFVSQSSLSQTIKRLEKEIGYSLFDRNGKHISLNENGRIFLQHITKMKAIYEEALEEIAETNNIQNKEISINMQCASRFLPQLMLYLDAKLPDSSFRITQQNHALSPNEEVDLILLATPDPLDSTHASLLIEEDILLAVPQNHRLFSYDTIKISDLITENFISLNPAWSLERAIRAECEKKDFCPRTTIQVDNPDILRRLIAEELGLAFIPAQTWGSAFANGKFALRTVSDFSMKRYVYLVWREGFLRENVRLCISHIEEFFHNCI